MPFWAARPRISRAEAEQIAKERDGLFPEVYAGVPVEAVLDHIGMTREHLRGVLDGFTNREVMRELSQWASQSA